MSQVCECQVSRLDMLTLAKMMLENFISLLFSSLSGKSTGSPPVHRFILLSAISISKKKNPAGLFLLFFRGARQLFQWVGALHCCHTKQCGVILVFCLTSFRRNVDMQTGVHVFQIRKKKNIHIRLKIRMPLEKCACCFRQRAVKTFIRAVIGIIFVTDDTTDYIVSAK